MKNIVMIGHGGFGNKGCEAIVRSTSGMIKSKEATDRITLASYEFAADSGMYPDERFVDRYVDHFNKVHSIDWLKAAVARRMEKRPYTMYDLQWLDKTGILKTGDLFLSVGGDNYCSAEPEYFYLMNEKVRRAGKPTFLWGASVDVKYLSGSMRKDLQGYKKLFIRESLSYNALREAGFENAVLCADPAFNLELQPVRLPECWKENATIGLNFSPLIEKHETRPGIVAESVRKLVEHILSDTGCSIFLIPHVVQSIAGQNDLEFLQPLFERYQSTGRVALIDYTLNAGQLKYVISKCQAFIGARTHSTIAAYSSLVPTLVLGYSIKARGIALDLFGDESLVLPVQKLENSAMLADGIDILLRDNEKIRNRLQHIVPEKKLAAASAVDELLKCKGK